MFKFAGMVKWGAGSLATVFSLLAAQCALGCLRNPPGAMPHGWLWKLTGTPCDRGTLILLIAVTLTFASIALFASLGRFAARR